MSDRWKSILRTAADRRRSTACCEAPSLARSRVEPHTTSYTHGVLCLNTFEKHLSKSYIYEYWNVDGDREMSVTWTGFTRFTILDEKPPDGQTWSGERLTKKWRQRARGREREKLSNRVTTQHIRTTSHTSRTRMIMHLNLFFESTTAGSRHGRLRSGSLFAIDAVVRGETTESSLRYRAWDPLLICNVAGPSRGRKSRSAFGTQCGICILRQPQTLKR